MNEQALIGQTIGNYRVETFIARGGFGAVYKARHLVFTERPPVAIKILNANLSSKEAHERFLQEARVLEKLKHTGILAVLDAGIQQLSPYLITEYAPRGSLYDRIQWHYEQPFALGDAIRIVSRVGQALHYAHQQGVIHRDLKPANILFDAKDESLLADFGIATVAQQTTTMQLEVVGSPPYMAPELFYGTASRKGDQYALACIAYELLTGKRPFQVAPTSTVFVWAHVHATQPPTPMQYYNKQLPQTLQDVVFKALAKDRNERYPDVAAFIYALEQVVQSLGYLQQPLKIGTEAPNAEGITQRDTPPVDSLPQNPQPFPAQQQQQIQVQVPAAPVKGQQTRELFSNGTKGLAFLCYLLFWPASLIVLCMKGNQNRFLRFHAWQATLYFGLLTIFYLVDLSPLNGPGGTVKSFASLVFLMLTLLLLYGWLTGLVQTLRGKMPKLLFVGWLAERLVPKKILYNKREPYNPPAGAYGAEADGQARVFAALCYLLLGLPVIFYSVIPHKKHFIVYHALQALSFFVPMFALGWLTGGLVWLIFAPVILASWLMGIGSALSGRYYPLPFVGRLIERYLSSKRQAT